MCVHVLRVMSSLAATSAGHLVSRLASDVGGRTIHETRRCVRAQWMTDWVSSWQPANLVRHVSFIFISFVVVWCCPSVRLSCRSHTITLLRLICTPSSLERFSKTLHRAADDRGGPCIAKRLFTPLRGYWASDSYLPSWVTWACGIGER